MTTNCLRAHRPHRPLFFCAVLTLLIGHVVGAAFGQGSVTTLSPTNLNSAAGSALAQALVYPNGGAAIVFFQYGTNVAYNTTSGPVSVSAGAGPILASAAIFPNLPNATFHIRAVITNSLGTAVGNDLIFSMPVTPPLVLTGATSQVGSTGVVVAAQVDPRNAPGQVYIRYGTVSNSFGYGFATGATNISGIGAKPVSLIVSNLQPNTTYFYGVTAYNSGGTNSLDDLSFTTVPLAPGVSAPVASSIGGQTFLLSSLVNPNSGLTAVHFECSKVGDSNVLMSPTNLVSAGSGSVTISAKFDQLIANTCYTCRVIAFNAGGTGTATQTVCTLPIAPSVTTTAATGVNPTTATLTGNANPNGSATVASFQYGTTPAMGNSTTPFSIGNGIAAVPFTQPIAGLSPNTLYYYRAMSGNAAGQSTGGVAVLTTRQTPPTVTSPSNSVSIAAQRTRQAKGIGLIANGALDVFLTDPGAGYTTAPNVTVVVTSGTGGGSTVVATVASGAVSALTLQTPGSYSTIAQVNIIIDPPPNPIQAAITNSAQAVILLPAGSFDANTIITRDVTIRGQGVSLTSITGGNRDSVFKVLPGVKVTFEDMTISQGTANFGGGIYNDGGIITINRCRITDNHAINDDGEGGGIFNRGSTQCTINDSEIDHNTSKHNGGGISNSGLNTAVFPWLVGGVNATSNAVKSLIGVVSDPQRFGLKIANTAKGLVYSLQDLGPAVANRLIHPGQIQSDFSGILDDITGSSIGEGLTRLSHADIGGNMSTNSEPYGNGWLSLGAGALFVNRTSVHDNTTTGVAASFGGGIENIVGLVLLTDCEIANNRVDSNLGSFGGGISTVMGAVRLDRCSVHDNVANSATVVCAGGAIFSAAGLLDVENSDLSDNSAVAKYLSRGGAIDNTAGARAIVTLSTLNGNSSGGGGGIQNDYNSFLWATNCTISSNKISGIIGANGGGVGNDEGGTVTLVGCTLDHNVATGFCRGGGIYNQCTYERWDVVEEAYITYVDNSTATLINCTLSSNSVVGTDFTIPDPSSLLECLLQNQIAPGSCHISDLPTISFHLPAQGGAAFNGPDSDDPLRFVATAELDLYSCTVIGNTSTGQDLFSGPPPLVTVGGGIFAIDSSSLRSSRYGNSTLNIHNTLFAKNLLNGAPSDFSTKSLSLLPTAKLTVNISGNSMDSDGTLILAKTTGAGGVYTQTNTFLGPLADNGGPTLTHALLTSSAALNNGSAGAPPIDQRGVSRPQNGQPDIGAFEAASPNPIPDSYSTLENHPLQVGVAAGVLSNDFGAGMIVGLTRQATNGVVVLAADGSFVYTPASNFVGFDSFTYTNRDSASLIAGPTVVSIRVDPILQLLSSTPPNGGANGARDQLSLMVDTSVDPAVIASGVIVRGAQSVVQPATVTVSNTVIKISPGAAFHAGELVTVEMLRSLVATNGAVFPVTKTFQYVTQVGAGSGQFPTSSNLNPDLTAVVVLADFDGNGTIDAYLGGYFHDQVWLNDGHGNFTQSQTLPGNTTGAAAGDLNGDGFLDIVVTKAGGLIGLPPQNVLNAKFPSDFNRVYFNDGTGHFTDSGQQLVPDIFVDPDTAPDPSLFQPITTTYFYNFGTWTVYQSTYTPDISAFYHYLNQGSSGVGIGDLNGDGYLDLFIINDTSKTVYNHTVSTPGNTVWLNNGHGSFTRSGPKLGIERAHGIVLADVNGDGALDAVVAAEDGTEIYLNDGNANFSQSARLQVSDDHAQTVVVGDVNGDGFPDIISGNGRPWYDLLVPPPYGNQVYTNDGHGNFTGVQFFGNVAAYGMALGDLNADGKLDLFATGLIGSEVWINTGTNFVKQGSTLGTDHWGRSVQLGDLDGDGDLDAFVGNYGFTADTCQVLFNDARPAVNNFNFTVPEEGFLSVPPVGVLSGASDFDGPALLLKTNAVKIYTAPTLGALIGLVANLPDFNPGNFSYDSQGKNIYLQTVPVFTSHGTLNLRADGSFTYTPTPLFHGTDNFSFVTSDGFLSATGTVTITVTPINHAPLARSDYYPLSGNPLIVASNIGVLANDSDPDGDSVTASLAQGAAHGVVTVQADGSFTYTAAAGYNGPDSFLYRVSDGQTNSIGRVKLGNTAPIARDDLNYAMPGNGVLTVTASTGVLVNDSDADGDVISASLVTAPAHGTVTFNSDGSFSYVRATNFSGADFFAYRASDGIANSSVARVKIGNTQPTGVNDGPYTAFLNQTLIVSAAQGVLANDQDAEGDKLTAHLLTGPTNGAMTLNSDGSFTYIPNGGYSGNDAFTYSANDGVTDSQPILATVGVYGFLHVTGQNPAANSVALSSNSIQIRFDGNLDPLGTAGKFVVHGSLSGVHTWNASVASNQVTLTLPQAFADGENVDVSVLSGLRGVGYLQLVDGFNYQFNRAAPRGSANYTNRLVGTANAFHTMVVAGDLNGDGLPDALTVNGANIGDNARIYLNQGNGNFIEQSVGTSGDFGRYRLATLADFDGNGSLDAFLIGTFTEFWQNDGAGNFTIHQIPEAPYFVQFMAVGDFNQDGAMDVFACGSDFSTSVTDSKGNTFNPAVFWVWFNDGHGNFTLGPLQRTDASLSAGAVGDVNGDGSPDAWLTGFYGDQLWINDGTGQFSPAPQALGANWGQSVVLGDLNGDGTLDAMVYYYPEGTRTWFNDGSGKFALDPQPLLLTNNVSQLALGDIMGNGRLDLAVACRIDVSGSNGLSLVLTNDGTGHFSAGSFSPASADCMSLALADFDRNGSLDAFFAVGGAEPGTNQVWLNHRMPVANDDAYPSATTTIAAPGVLANDLAGDGPQFNAVLNDQPLHGSVALAANGGFTYTPGGGFAGTDVFTYQVFDGIQNSRIARVKIGNTAPIAIADTNYFALNDLPLDVSPTEGVLVNDIDSEGDPLVALLSQNPAHGVLRLNANGSFLYTAAAGYTGADTFTYRATDGYATSAVATVKITVGARLSVTEKTPSAGALTAPRNSGVVVQFNHPLNPASVLGQVAVSGNLSGPHSSVVSTVSNVLSITPAVPFSPGELVSVTLASGLRGLLGERMVSPIVWQFTVAAPFGLGQLANSGQLLIPVNGTNAAAVALADVDGDGKLDAVVGHGGDFIFTNGVLYIFPDSKATMIWHNNGNGVFTDTGLRLGTNTTAALLTLDVNGDGAPDIVVAKSQGPSELWLNNGSGTFSASPQTFLLSDQTVTNNPAVVAGDFNGDGSPDLAFLQALSQFPDPNVVTIGIWTNNGSGVFTDSGQRLQNAGDANPGTLVVGDVFGHGALDIIELNLYSGARIWENDGTGRFSDTGITFGPGFISGGAVGDLNGDGILDFVGIATTNVTVWLNDGQGNFSSFGEGFAQGAGTPSALKLADMDGDGHLDVVVLDWMNQFQNGTNLNTSRIFYNDGSANFTDRGTMLGTYSMQARAMAIGDLNGDSAPDVFLVNFLQPRTVWFNSAGLGPLLISSSLTISDTSTAAPFSSVTLQTPPGATVTLSVQIDNLAKGAFTTASLGAGGFTGPVGSTHCARRALSPPLRPRCGN